MDLKITLHSRAIQKCLSEDSSKQTGNACKKAGFWKKRKMSVIYGILYRGFWKLILPPLKCIVRNVSINILHANLWSLMFLLGPAIITL
jgi:hypothetical protein